MVLHPQRPPSVPLKVKGPQAGREGPEPFPTTQTAPPRALEASTTSSGAAELHKACGGFRAFENHVLDFRSL